MNDTNVQVLLALSKQPGTAADVAATIGKPRKVAGMALARLNTRSSSGLQARSGLTGSACSSCSAPCKGTAPGGASKPRPCSFAGMPID